METSGIFIRSAIVWLVLLLAACGGGGYGADDPGNSALPPPPPGIGPAGGTVTGPNGAKVAIPAGALATSTPIAIAQTTAGSPPLPAGLTTAGLMFAFTPHGTTFAAPVTVTLPFDPASIAAGATPALFKTNAQNQWEQVANATFAATTVTAQVTSFSSFTVGLNPLDRTVSSYKFKELRTVTGGFEFVEAESELVQGGELTELRDFGDAHFDSSLLLIDGTAIPRDNRAHSYVGSTEDGRTLQVSAEAPVGNASVENEVVGLLSELIQVQTFIKREENARLTFRVPLARIELHDENAELGRTCPPRGSCAHVVGVVKFRLDAIDSAVLDADPLPASIPAFFSLSGSALLGGFAEHWVPGIFNDAGTMLPAWEIGDFRLTRETENGASEARALLTLASPLTFDVDLSSIPVGGEFKIQITLSANAQNVIAGPPSERPTSAGAYLNVADPDAGGGGSPVSPEMLTSTGLESVDDSTPFTATLGGPISPAACVPGPGPAGSLQFSNDTYLTSEAGVAPTILVTRVAGSTGPVTATVATGGGTAIEATDYVGVNTTVFFADGDTAPRSVDVQILEDANVEGDETANITLSQPGGCATLGTRNAAVLTIEDNEAAPAPPSGLDPTFGDGGEASSNAFGGDRSGMALQADGKVVMVGGTFTDFILARFDTDGTLDETFDVDGKVTTNMVTGEQEEALGVAIQPDGKIVVVGYTGQTVGPSVFALARYLPNGTLDDTFGVGGKAIGNVVGRAFAVVLQPDGRIVVAGDEPANEDFVVARFEPNGTLDDSFADFGFLVTDIEDGADLGANVVLQPNGAIVVSGPHTNPGDQPRDLHTGLMRLDSEGNPDDTFGVEGQVLLRNESLGEGLALQSNGRLVLVGRENAAIPPQLLNEFAIIRLTSNGSPDGTFGTQGRVSTSITGRGDEALAVAVQSDGRIVVAGRSNTQTNSNFAITRYTSAGVLDSSFGNGGIVEIDFFGFTDIAESVAILGDGRIVVGGLARNNVDGYGVARVLP